MTVSLPIPPSSLSPNSREHYYTVARDKARYRQDAGRVIRQAIFFPVQCGEVPWSGPVCIHAVWQTPHPRWLPDVDAATARLKPAIDAAEDAGLILNDRQVTAITVERVVGRTKGVTLTFTREDG